MTQALVALGSNLGDRAGHLAQACAALGRLPATRLLACSRWYETPPEAPGDGGPYLNGAALLETRLGPASLLRALREIERRAGRPPRRERGPRTLDLDLILCGQARLQTPELTLPHPRYRQRAFVLEPAREVAPRLRDPERARELARIARP